MTDVSTIAMVRSLMRANNFSGFSEANDWLSFVGKLGERDRTAAEFLLDNPQLEVFFDMEKARPGLDIEFPLLMPRAEKLSDVFHSVHLTKKPWYDEFPLLGAGAVSLHRGRTYCLRPLPDGTVTREINEVGEHFQTAVSLHGHVVPKINAAMRFDLGFFILNGHADGQLLVARSADMLRDVNVAFFSTPQKVSDMFCDLDTNLMAFSVEDEASAWAGLEHVDGLRWRLKEGATYGCPIKPFA